MESIEKLEHIKAILEKNFFEEHLDIFWGWFQKQFICPGKQWDGRDYFDVAIQYNSKSDEMRYSLSQELGKDVKFRFAELEKAFLTDIVALNEESQNNLIQIIRQKLNTIKIGAEDLSLPKDYDAVIHKHFTLGENKFMNLLDEYNYPRISEHGFYYKKLHTKEGRRAFKKFYKEILTNGFIGEEITEDEFKDLFSQRKLSKKIIWGGSPEEAQYFFTTLDAKEFIETNSIWITVGEHFLIRKKRGDFFDPKKLRGLPKLKEEVREEKDRMTEIKSAIDILNI